MPDKIMPGPVDGCNGVREAVCIHTRKIFDSCRDKDCIEDLRFYPKLQYVDVINRALSVKGGSAKLLYVYVDVEPVSFNRGFYTVDMRFFYHVTLQAYLSCPAPVTVEGLCVFDKRVILFGSSGINSVRRIYRRTCSRLSPPSSAIISRVRSNLCSNGAQVKSVL